MSEGPDALLAAARRIVDRLVGVRSGERVSLVTDPGQPVAVLDALSRALDEREADRLTLLLTPADLAAPELPRGLVAALGGSQVIVSTCGRLLTHTDAVRAALARGGRYCNLRDLSADTLLEGAGRADPDEMRALTADAARLLSSCRRIEVTDRSGSSIAFETDGVAALALDGSARDPGSIGGVPAGEASIVPKAGTATGTIRHPFLIEGLGATQPDLEIVLDGGRMVTVTGRGSEELARIVAKHVLAPIAGEFALGTNRASRLLVGREAKKRLGTAHLGFGDNLTFGGSTHCPIHLDVVFDAPTVLIDGRQVISEGRWTWRS